MENVINKVTLTGFAGSDAEVKVLSGNQKLARVNLAVNEYYKNAAGEEDLAEEQIKKGTRLTIEGKLQTGSYEAKDGSKRYTTDIVVNEVAVITALETVN